MYKINFYKDKKGNEPVAEYIKDLSTKKDKDSRIKLNKIRDYLKILSEYGTKSGNPYVKHIKDKIWELRPLRDRIFFFYWKDDCFILLHHFIKRTQKTPKREILKADKEVSDFLERRTDYE